MSQVQQVEVLYAQDSLLCHRDSLRTLSSVHSNNQVGVFLRGFSIEMHLGSSRSKIENALRVAVQYGLERMNQEVSLWMRGLHNADGSRPTPPFFATG